MAASAIAFSTTGYFTRLIKLDVPTLLFWQGLFGGLFMFCCLLLTYREKTVAAFRSMGRSGIAIAILMALAIVREKELGSIVNLYVTPVTRLEFLLGKQIPYIAVAMINFVVLLLMALFIFEVPLKGSFPLLVLAALIYVTTTTAYGRVISTFTSTQIAALFGTAILTVLPATMFAGMLVPISSITGMGAILGRLFPMTYFLPISVGTFTKGLGFTDLTGQLLALAAFVPALTLLSLVLLRRQEK